MQLSLRLVTGLVALVIGLSLATVTAAHPAAAPAANVVGLGGAPCSYPTIGDALAAAAGGDTVYVSPGTYNEVLGTLDKDLSLTAATADCTAADAAATPFDYVIDGGGAAAFDGGVLNIAPNRSVTITRMILQNAQAVHGGIVYVDEGATATFHTVRLRNGAANNLGGILYVAPNASLYVTNTTFIEDGLAGNAGGGLYLEGQAEFFSGVVIRASQAPLGAGVAMAGEAQLNLRLSHVGDGSYPNTAGTGGGVHMTGQSRLDLHQGSTIRWNNATGNDGGGVYAAGGVTVELHGSSRIYGNEALAYGGGVYAGNGASVTLNDYSQIGDANPAWGNTAVRGGGLYADGALSLTVRDEAAVRNNSAGDGGGGIYLAGDTLLSMNGGYIAGNQSTGWGGGLAIEVGQATLVGTVISGNVAMEGGGVGLDNNVANEFTAINSQIISNTANLDGGGIHSQHASVSLADTDGTSRLAGNQAGLAGGGLWSTGFDNANFWAHEPGSELRIEANTAGTNGGGLYSENQGSVYLIGSVWLAGNTALGDGGGWYQDGGGVLVAGTGIHNRAHVAGNTALNGRGGGVYLTDVSSGPGVVASPLGNVTLSGNQADTEGGGLYVTNGSYVQLINALVHENQAGQEGGGVMVSAARLEVSQYLDDCQNALLPANHYCSEFRQNTASVSGGAVGLELAAELSLENTAVISNSASLGSGVMSSNNGDQIEITNSLFSHNTGKTLYIANDGSIELVQSTLADNEWAIDINDNGAAAELQNNLIWGNDFGVESAVVSSGGCSISQNGVGGVISDPLFHTTGRGDYRLQSDSPAINACGIGTDADLDGILRPQGTNYDMGAFEAGRPLVIFPAQLAFPEGHSGLTPAPFVVTLSETSVQTITLDVQAVSVRAIAGVDFNALGLTLTFPPGTISQTVPLELMGDLVFEGDEAFELHFSGAVEAELPATTAVMVIENDDALPELAVASAEVAEGHSGTAPINLAVSLSHASAFTVTVDYVTSDDTATAGADYQATSGTLTFAPGELTAEITVQIEGDEMQEGDEQLVLTLNSADGATISLAEGQALVTIQEDDDVWHLYVPIITR